MTILGILTATMLTVSAYNGNPIPSESFTRSYASFDECMAQGVPIMQGLLNRDFEGRFEGLTWVCTDGEASRGMYYSRTTGDA